MPPVTATTGPFRWAPHVIRLRAGAALPDAHPELLAEVEPANALHQLAAGPATATTSRASCSRARRDELVVDVDLVADMAVINPFDFFVEPSAETVPFAYERVAGAGARALLAR